MCASLMQFSSYRMSIFEVQDVDLYITCQPGDIYLGVTCCGLYINGCCVIVFGIDDILNRLSHFLLWCMQPFP